MILGILMLAIAVLTGCGGSQGTSSSSAAKSATSSSAAQAGKDVTIKMLNVGQGDSILIQTAEQTVLIDTSDVDERDKFKRELDKAGVKKIDKVILTHPHADHIGGMDVLLKDYQVGEVYDNGMPSTSKLYIGYMKQLKSKGIKHTALKAGDVLDFGGGVSFKVFYPTKELVEKGTQKGYKHDPNNESVVGKLIYGDFSMLFISSAHLRATLRIRSLSPTEVPPNFFTISILPPESGFFRLPYSDGPPSLYTVPRKGFL